MEGIEELVSVPVITSLVYVAMMLFKYFANGKESLIRLIPALAVIVGIILGIAVYYVTPELMLASNVFSAMLVGASSGLAATGTHQIFKQLQPLDIAENSLINTSEEAASSSNEEIPSDSALSKENSLSKTTTNDQNKLEEVLRMEK